MKKNIGSADKMVRIIAAIVIAVLYFTNIINGTLGTILLIVGAILLATSLIDFCPIYKVLGMNTNKNK